MNSSISALKSILGNYLENENIYFHYKGRVSLFTILKAMGIGKGDEVIIPAYTCVVVPNPIIYLGAKPIYVDINAATFNMDASKIEERINSKTKAIIIQNTYGLSSEVEEVLQIAKKNQLYTIEDCTHGFGGSYNGEINGSYCDAAFYSSQWNKPFSSGLGGFLVVNNTDLIANINALEKEKVEPSYFSRFVLKLLYFIRRYLITDKSYFFFVRFYRLLSKMNLIIGSSSGGEINSTEMPAGFFMNYSETQAKEALRSIKNFDAVLKLRKENALKYSRLLKEKNKKYVDLQLFDNHTFLKYPILVSDREAFMEKAVKNNIPIGDWFLSVIHPVQKDFEQWFINPEDYPVAHEISQHILNLPTDTIQVEKVIEFLTKNIEDIV